MWNRIALRGAALALIVVAGACGGGTPQSQVQDFDELARESLSQIEGALDVPGLQASVEILRDDWGIAHIYAQNRHDLFFAQGYVQAQDRLWQMDMWRRINEGRLAEEMPGAVASQRGTPGRPRAPAGPFGLLATPLASLAQIDYLSIASFS